MVRARWVLAAVLCAALLGATPAPALSPESAEISVELGRLEGLLERAHFREAAEKALSLRNRALALPPSAEVQHLAVRAELLAGSAAVALGQSGFARECFHRALRLDPRLVPSDLPPKVQRAFDAARATPP